MKKQNLFSLLAIMFCLFVGLTSCSEDNDNKGNNGGGLVSDTLPTEKGWAGSMENGECTYTPESYDEYPGYFAFSFDNGVCEDAVYNVICSSASEAISICDMLNNGTFDDLMGDDEEYATKGIQSSVLSQSLEQIKAIREVISKGRVATRSDMLGITCYQSGKVVFFKLECFNGKDGETVQTAVEFWFETNMDSLPKSPLFGQYNSNTGKYTNNNIMGIANTKYEIDVKFSGDLLIDFVTTLTLPNPSWALMLEESFREQEQDYINMFGQAPEIIREGNVVTVKAIIIGDVTKELVEQYIVILDLTMNMPIGLTFL